MINSPCKNCKDRKVNCHSICQAYKVYSDIKERFREDVKRRQNRDIHSYKIDSIEKTIKRLGML